MKAKTSLEHRLVVLSKKIPAITQKQNELAFARCFPQYAVRSRNTVFCLECGHSWGICKSENAQKIQCEKCNGKLQLIDGYSNGKKETDYYQIITTAKEFQVVRMICITKTMKKNTKSSFFGHEVMRIFIDKNGKSRYFSKNVMGMSQYYDQWIISSDLSLKPNVETIRFYLSPSYILPNKKVIPILKRNGFQGKFYDIAPQLLLRSILSDSISETLLKSGQSNLLHYHIRNTVLKQDSIHWSALKICIRNNYKITDAKLWIDYVDLLEYFWKDIRNTKYVCPADLEKAHNKLMRKKMDEELAKTFEEKKAQIDKNQQHYIKAKKQFFGLVFSEKNISINVLETVKEFLEEGYIHNHCVFTNEYYKKKNSLILSAKVDGVPTETIQLSLQNLEILQSRGKGNKASKYNKQIIDLVNKNLHKVGARMKAAS